jgi:hypothetical protein
MSELDPDRRPGLMPEIRLEREDTVFVCPVSSAQKNANGPQPHLVLRCDRNGNVWVAIRYQGIGSHRR